MTSQKNMSILWHSVAPHIRSGYGTVTRNVTGRIKQAGYPIVCSAYYGLVEGGVLKINDVPVIPNVWGDDLGRQTVPYLTQRFNFSLQILHTDFWAFDWFTQLPHPILYGPLDHVSYPEYYKQILKGFEDVIMLTEFAKQEIEKDGIKCQVIPHGVDTKIFKPMDKSKCRKRFNFSDDAFIAGVVAANADPEPRKGWDSLFDGLRIFFERNPDARKNMFIFAFTKANDSRGFALGNLARMSGVYGNVFFPEHYAPLMGISDEEMAMLMNCFDVLCSCSRREGFGLPIIEAQACGIPVIGTNFSSIPELLNYGKHGWLVKKKAWAYTPLNGKCVIPDEKDIAKKLEEAYFDTKLRKKYGRIAYNFAQRYDWDKLMKEKWIPYLESKEVIFKGKETVLDLHKMDEILKI